VSCANLLFPRAEDAIHKELKKIVYESFFNDFLELDERRDEEGKRKSHAGLVFSVLFITDHALSLAFTF
jgi:hypothetical protein